jgi:hypothetical protein
MTVRQLRKLLSKLPQDAQVAVDGFKGYRAPRVQTTKMIRMGTFGLLVDDLHPDQPTGKDQQRVDVVLFE